MKRIVTTLLAFVVCFGLCACGADNIELPTKPAQSTPQNMPVAQETQSSVSGEVQETTESTGESYPWEAEFNEKDFIKFNITAPKGEKITTWKEGSIFGVERRYLCQYPNGDILDEYYYPSGNASHSYFWGADGSYSESHYLDNGYTDLEKKMTYVGTVIYQRAVNADGSEYEQICDDDGNVTFYASKGADGSYTETCYFEDGTSKNFYNNPVTGWHNEEEYYGNGNLKYSKNQSPESTVEERYDEEGYCTYFYSKNTNWEIELTADETGKLIKVVENGTVYEEEASLAQYANVYNFRR